MRRCVEEFLKAAVRGFELDGPAALVTADITPYGVDASVGQLFAGASFISCRVPTTDNPVDELLLPELPIAPESLQVLVCLDLVRRFDEAQDLLEQAMTRLAAGGMLLMTADIGEARPSVGLSRVLTPLGLERLVARLDAAVVGWQGDIDFPKSLFVIAGPKPCDPRFGQRAGKFLELFQASQAPQQVSAPWYARLLTPWRRASTVVTAKNGESLSFSMHLPPAGNWKEALLELPHSAE
ncbi:MAG TPA: hypothetical protein VGJ26_01925 [Pirellulales bacterium]